MTRWIASAAVIAGAAYFGGGSRHDPPAAPDPPSPSVTQSDMDDAMQTGMRIGKGMKPLPGETDRQWCARQKTQADQLGMDTGGMGCTGSDGTRYIDNGRWAN